MDFVEYAPGVNTWGCSRVSGPRERQKPEDAIHVFLNYKLVGKFKTRLGAGIFIQKLMDEAPVSFEEFKDYLLA